MKRTGLIGILTMSAIGVAVACAVLPGITTPLIEVEPSASMAEIYDQLADKLGAIYHDQYKDTEIYKVQIPVTSCTFLGCSRQLISMIKPCGETLEETVDAKAEEIRERMASNGSGLSSSIGGLGDYSSGPMLLCSTIEGQTCTPTTCSIQADTSCVMI